jgi:hypothetical protein
MTRVLFVGQQPETVDFTNPMLPPGMNAERIHTGIALALKQMAERGWHGDLCLLRPDETAGPDVERGLRPKLTSGAALCTALITASNIDRLWGGRRMPAPITTQSPLSRSTHAQRTAPMLPPAG